MKKKSGVISTNRLVLHSYNACDEERMVQILCNEQIKKTFMIPDFQDIQQAKEMFYKLMEFSKSEEHFEYGVYLDQVLIGFVNNCGMDETSIELGYVILPEHHGKGYATEAVRACIDELFRMGFQKVTAGFFEENYPSRRVMEKCGMHQIEQEDDIEYQGVLHHCLYYGIENSN